MIKFIALMLISTITYASDFYGVLGVGQVDNKLNGNGIWYQEGFEHTIENRSTSGRIGFGYKVNSWLRVEALYHDFGHPKIEADFVIPDWNYNLDTHTCNGPCNPIMHGNGIGSTRGTSISLLPSYGPVYARIGVIHYKSQWDEMLRCCKVEPIPEGSLYGHTDPTLWPGDNDEIKPTNKGFSPIFGIGVRYDILTIEYVRVKFRALGSGFVALDEVSINLNLEF